MLFPKKILLWGQYMMLAMAYANSLYSSTNHVLTWSGNKNKNIVLMAGDEEYRSEETMPMLAKVLSSQHGFNCKVLFSWDSTKSHLDPNNKFGMIGMENLEDADLLVIGTRFRELDEQQSAHLASYLRKGKPIIGLRTATHAFAGKGSFSRDVTHHEFGLKILGETWVAHHGLHKIQGTRSVIAENQGRHGILHGVTEIFAYTDVYAVTHLTPNDIILLKAIVVENLSPSGNNLVKQKPHMPLAWLHEYKIDGGKAGQSFCTTMGASVDFLDQGLLRLVVNACYFLLDEQKPNPMPAELPIQFSPTFYGFIKDKGYWAKLNWTLKAFEKGPITLHHGDPPGTPRWQGVNPRSPLPRSSDGTTIR